MARCTFKQFQAMYPDDAACLAKLMEVNYGGYRDRLYRPRQGHEIPSPNQAPRLRLATLRSSRLSMRGHDLSQVANEPGQMVLRDVSHDKHAPRPRGEGDRAATRRDLQVRCHELRKLMASGDYKGSLSGHVEIDETRVGGKQKQRDRRRKGDNKVLVMGIIDATTLANLEHIVTRNVTPVAIVSTDEWGGNDTLAERGFIQGPRQSLGRRMDARRAPQ
jgi:transposase